MSDKKKKRFIAGAVCPKCEHQDTLMLYLQNNVEKVECINCGHTMVQPEKQVAAAAKGADAVIGVFKPE